MILSKEERARERVELGKRLGIAADEFQSGAALAKKIGRSQTGVRKWIQGAAEPSFVDLKNICEATGIRFEWLVYGVEPRRSSDLNKLAAPINEELFLALLITFEEQAQQMGITLDPLTKGQLFISVYEMTGSQDRINVDSIRRLLKAANEDNLSLS